MKHLWLVCLLFLCDVISSSTAWAFGVVETTSAIDTSTATATDTSTSTTTQQFNSLSFKQTSLGSTTTAQTNTVSDPSANTSVATGGQIGNKLNFLSSSWKLGGMTSSQNNFGATPDTSIETSASSSTSTSTQTSSAPKPITRRVLVS